MENIEKLIGAINAIEDRVWSIAVITLGCALLIGKQGQGGLMLIGGGLAIMQRKGAPADPPAAK